MRATPTLQRPPTNLPETEASLRKSLQTEKENSKEVQKYATQAKEQMYQKRQEMRKTNLQHSRINRQLCAYESV